MTRRQLSTVLDGLLHNVREEGLKDGRWDNPTKVAEAVTAHLEDHPKLALRWDGPDTPREAGENHPAPPERVLAEWKTLERPGPAGSAAARRQLFSLLHRALPRFFEADASMTPQRAAALAFSLIDEHPAFVVELTDEDPAHLDDVEPPTGPETVDLWTEAFRLLNQDDGENPGETSTK